MTGKNEERTATDADWFDIAGKMEQALRHIETLSDSAFASIVENAEMRDHPEKRWTIPDFCMNDVSALLYAIRGIAARAQEPAR